MAVVPDQHGGMREERGEEPADVGDSGAGVDQQIVEVIPELRHDRVEEVEAHVRLLDQQPAPRTLRVQTSEIRAIAESGQDAQVPATGHLANELAK